MEFLFHNIFLLSYEECSGSTEASSVTMKLVSERNFIIYDDKEEIVREKFKLISD